MSLVLDASTTLAWYFDDETTPETDAVLEQVARAGAVVPSLWCLEVSGASKSPTHFKWRFVAKGSRAAIAMKFSRS